MSEVLAASGTLGKLNLDGGKRQARADLFGFMQTLLAIDQTVEPAMHARTLDEREGPAAATAAARSDRAAADAADTALCQRLMGHLIVATVGEARTIVTTAMGGREALAALIEFVDGDASTPDGSDAIIADTSEISWNTFPNGLELSKFTYDILARLAYAAGESATAYAQTPYNAGDPLYQSLVRGLVKAIGPDHAPHTFNAVHSALAVELHKPESTLSYQEAMHAIRAQARSIGRDRPASLSTMTVVQAETNSLGLGDRPATLQMTRRADDARARKFEKVWCDRCAGWGHRGVYCDLPDDEVVCLLCREVGHDLSKCRKKGPLGYRTWNPNGGDAMPTILHRAGSPERTEFDRRREREVLRRAGRQRGRGGRYDDSTRAQRPPTTLVTSTTPPAPPGLDLNPTLALTSARGQVPMIIDSGAPEHQTPYASLVMADAEATRSALSCFDAGGREHKAAVAGSAQLVDSRNGRRVNIARLKAVPSVPYSLLAVGPLVDNGPR